MADYTVTLGPAKEAVVRYFYLTVDDFLDYVVTKALKRMVSTIIENETEYNPRLDETRKEEILALLETIPTLEDRLAATQE